MKAFSSKSCLVVGGHETHVPNVITYPSMFSREIVCKALTVAALCDLEVKVAGVLNANVIALNKEKIWMVKGPEFRNDAGKLAIIFRACGLKSVCAVCRS